MVIADVGAAAGGSKALAVGSAGDAATVRASS